MSRDPTNTAACGAPRCVAAVGLRALTGQGDRSEWEGHSDIYSNQDLFLDFLHTVNGRTVTDPCQHKQLLTRIVLTYSLGSYFLRPHAVKHIFRE